MNIQDLVPDLKICQEAKDKGVVIESEYYWWHRLNDSKWMISPFNEIFNGDCFPAPLTDEILLKLPKHIRGTNENVPRFPNNNYPFKLTISYSIKKGWSVSYAGLIKPIYDKNKLSNALLLLAIKLKEEGIIN